MAIPPSPLAGQLPLLALGWECFEKFCHALVGRLPDLERSHREGGQGDAQRGVDIIAVRADGDTWAFQCKCVKGFTPALFHRAVTAASFEADRYVILLAVQATAAVREAARRHPRWDVWDVDDICERVRGLPAESARALVDAHFGPEWRQRFLGRTGPALFVSMDEFFRPLLDTARIFHHDWAAIGRGDTLRALHEFAASPERRIAILPGRGGIGKTKVLQEFARAAEDRGTRVRFAVSGVPLTAAALDELEPGPGVVVVDDAHQRDDLPALFAAARRSHTPFHLVLALRPYAHGGIHTALSRAGFDVSEILSLSELGELTPAQTEALAREALGPEYLHLAGPLAGHGGDSPLATVLGAQFIRREQLDPRLLSQRDEFRRIVLAAFRDELLGRVSDRADAGICRGVLRLAAAIGPFRPELPSLQAAAGAFLGIRADEWHEALRALEEAGVLLRRSSMLRITPDVLADYVLEDACLDPGGRSSGYAERVHEAFRGAAPGALLRNLAELDWRRAHGGIAAGGNHLTGGIWADMEREFREAGVERRAEMIRGLGVVAYYQPEHALRLVRMAGPSPAFWAGPGEAQALARVVPPVLGTIAYNLDYTEECCDLLWRLARDQPLNALDPQDPLSVLHELAGYRFHKPIELQDAVVTAVQRWMAAPDVQQHLRSPLDVLTPVLAKTALSPGWDPLFVLPEPTAALRERALSIVAAVARQEDVRAARRAVQSLGYVLDEPIRPGGHALPDGFGARWRPYRMRALALLAEFIAAPAHPLVHLACSDRLAPHVGGSSGDPLVAAAQAAFAAINRSFELRFTELLLRVDVPAVYDVVPQTDPSATGGGRERQDVGRRETTAEFLVQYPDPADGLARIEARVLTIDRLAIDPMQADASCLVIAEHLAELDPDYTADLCERAVLGPPSTLLAHLPPWLWRVRQTRPDRYLHLARQALRAGGVPECVAVAATLWDPEGPPLDGADDLLPQTLAHPDSRVRREALAALWLLARRDPDRATELALTVELGRSADLADRFAEMFVAWHPAVDALAPSAWEALLEKLVPVEHLDTWAVHQLLRLASRVFPRGVVRMLRTRIRRVAGEPSAYRPLPSVQPEALDGFLTASDHERILREIRDALLELPRAEAEWMPWLYSLASAGYGDAGLRVLREWVDGRGAQGILAVCEMLGGVGPDFLTERVDYVESLLLRADAAGLDVLKTVQTTLYDVLGRAATEGANAGWMGGPWPPLVHIKDKGQELSADRSRHRLTRRFYQELARLAEERIQAERDLFEEQLH